MAADPRRPSRTTAIALLASPQERLLGAVRLTLLTFLLACWVVGGYAGIVYWSFQGSLLGMIASALFAGLAAAATWSAFTALERARSGES